MAASTSFWPDSMRTIAPWLLATAATLAAFVILSMFIDTLHMSMQRGVTLRAALAAADMTVPGPDIRLAATGADLAAGSR